MRRHTLPLPLLRSLSEFVAQRMGLAFPQERWRDLEQALAAAAPAFGAEDAEACARRLLSGPLTHEQLGLLAKHLTVGETYFFRERRVFEAIENHILPDLLRRRAHGERRLRIWSAGCCTGEEPYSIAMLLDRLLPRDTEWNVTILATDINPQFLHQAKSGIYSDWSFRDTPAWLKERYFQRRKDGRFEIQPSIRRRVAFAQLNLADDASYPSLSNNTQSMDVIFCRNVLMYFAEEQARQVVENFRRSLADGGWLIVSPVEASIRLFSRFAATNFPGAVLYRRLDAEAEAVVAGSALPVAEFENLQPPAAVVPDAAASLPVFTAAPPAEPQAPESAEAVSLMARACADQGRLSDAMAWCRKAIAADKLNPAHHHLLATIQQELGQPEAAARSLLGALYLAPDFVPAHVALGNLRCSQGRPREAERHFDNALALLRTRPPDAILPDSAGLTASRLGEIVESLRSRLAGAPIGP